jgi:CubicO group peptidase (beta-lactamase class C family)
MKRLGYLLSLLLISGCGGVGVFNPPAGDPGFQANCEGGPDVIMETDEQAYLQIGGAFDQLRHDEGAGVAPVKMTTKIDKYVKTYMCQQRVPGLAIGVIWQGNLVYVKGYGLARGWETADPADDVPVRGQRTRFRWASVSKCVTGVAAVMATQELGFDGEPLLDLDASLALNYRCLEGGGGCAFDLPTTYFPGWFPNMVAEDWPIDSEAIPDVEDTYDFTIRRLISNHCGVRHYDNYDPALPGGTPPEADKMVNDGFVWALDYWTAQPLVRLPGTTYEYSSFGFNMAGAAMEFAVPGGYWGYVKARIADATQLTPMQYFHPDDVYDDQYAQDPWLTAQDRVHGYRKSNEGDVVVNTTPGDVSYKVPSGGYISTVADMALFAHGLIHNDYLDEAATELLWTPQALAVQGLPGAPATGYALGFIISQCCGERLVSHSGKQQDARSQLRLFPDGEDPAVGQMAVVVMSNAEYANPGTVAIKIEEFLRNPFTAAGAVLFEGTEPRDLSFAEQDAAQRNAPENGPYVLGGLYNDPQRDVYSLRSTPVLRVLPHRYNPDYEPGPTTAPPDLIPENDDLEPTGPEQIAVPPVR